MNNVISELASVGEGNTYTFCADANWVQTAAAAMMAQSALVLICFIR
jgi:hypothetical protein